MKKIIFLYLMWCISISFSSNAQSGSNKPTGSDLMAGVGSPITPPSINTSHDLNYIRVFKPRTFLTNPTSIYSGIPAHMATQVISYTDGSNEPYETVMKNVAVVGGQAKHLVQLSDNRSMPDNFSFLPFATQNQDFVADPFQAQRSFYVGKYSSEGSYAYGKTTIISNANERSVVGYTPGKATVGQGRGSKTKRMTNAVSEVRYWQLNGSGEPYTNSTYPEKTLIGAETILPDNVTGFHSLNSPRSRVFTDRDGRVVLKMVADSVYTQTSPVTQEVNDWQKTYYVYDETGNLQFTIPPKAVKLLEQNGWNVTTAIMDELLFRFHYDDKGRIVSSRRPGENGFTELIYDKRNRVIMSRNPNQAFSGEWSVTFYDPTGRIHATSVYNSGANRATMQAGIDSWTGGTVSDLMFYLCTDAGAVSPPAESAVSGNTMMSYIYFDDYAQADPGNFARDAFDTYGFLVTQLATGVGHENPKRSSRNYGMVTGSKVRILPSDGTSVNETGQWRSSVTFYDDKGRVIQAYTGDWVSSVPNAIRHHFNSVQYNFSNQVLMTKQVMFHYGSQDSYTTHTELNRNVYEQETGNLSATYHKLNDGSWQTLAIYKYDELGRVSQKSIGGGGEVQDFTYDVQGKLKGINANYAESGIKNGVSRSFGESISYEVGFEKARYDGRISGVIWRGAQANNATNTKKHAYGYHYDISGRLKSAEYNHQYETLGVPDPWAKDLLDYSVSDLYYDKNGNITHMKQMGVNPGNGPVVMDNMSYQYENGEVSNRLSSVTDAVSNNYGTGDFQNGVNSGADYDYDYSGNLTMDLNKGINRVKYTRFNKPLEVLFTNGDRIEYSYDAAGNKIRELTIVAGGSTKKRDYISNFLYEDDSLRYVIHSEGRSMFNTPHNRFKEEFFVKDRLGNVRSTIDVYSYPIRDYLATYEIASANIEGQIFDYLDEIRESNPASPNVNNQEAGRLNGAEPERRIGTSMLMQVMAGDRVFLEVDNFFDGYDETKDEPVSEGEMRDAIIGVLTNGVGGFVGSESHNIDLLGAAFSTENWTKIANLTSNTFNSANPQAGLNYVLFDENMNIVSSFTGAFQANGNGTWATIGTATAMEIPQNGYLAVYLSNSSNLSSTCASCGDVFFDMLRVQITKGNLLEETHYYPHGLPITGLSSQSWQMKENRHKYQTNEYNKSLGLNWMDFQARQYDPQIGRFLGVDPLAAVGGQDKFSPYAAMGNMPESMIDPDGMQFLMPDNPTGASASEEATDRSNRQMMQNRVNRGIGSGGMFDGNFEYQGMSGVVLKMFYLNHPEEQRNIQGHYLQNGSLIAPYTTGGEGAKVTLRTNNDYLDYSMIDYDNYQPVNKDEVKAQEVVIQSTPSVLARVRFSPAQVDDFEGFWGKVSWVWSPHVGNGKYDWDGNLVGIRPIGGIAPTPSFKGLKVVNTIKAVRSAYALRLGKRGFTEVGYQFQKHVGRQGGALWRSALPESGKLNPSAYNQAGYNTFKEIWRGPGSFDKVGGFIEKRLPDGRGIRFQDNWIFKGFID